MYKFIFILLFITLGCLDKQKRQENTIAISNKPHVISDVVIKSSGIYSKLQRLIQFHIYYEGLLCGHVNCIASYKDEKLSDLKYIKIADIYNPKGLIDSVNLEHFDFGYQFQVHVGRNYNTLLFSLGDYGSMMVDSHEEVPLKALQDENSGIRLAKSGDSNLLPIIFRHDTIDDSNKSHVISDVVIKSSGIYSKLQQLIQFHIYYEGLLCGYVNCITSYNDNELFDLKNIRITDIYTYQSKVFIGNLSLINDDCIDESPIEYHLHGKYS